MQRFIPPFPQYKDTNTMPLVQHLAQLFQSSFLIHNTKTIEPAYIHKTPNNPKTHIQVIHVFSSSQVKLLKSFLRQIQTTYMRRGSFMLYEKYQGSVCGHDMRVMRGSVRSRVCACASGVGVAGCVGGDWVGGRGSAAVGEGDARGRSATRASATKWSERRSKTKEWRKEPERRGVV